MKLYDGGKVSQLNYWIFFYNTQQAGGRRLDYLYSSVAKIISHLFYSLRLSNTLCKLFYSYSVAKIIYFLFDGVVAFTDIKDCYGNSSFHSIIFFRVCGKDLSW